MDNNEVYSLFEDIKNDLKSINGKLENAPKVTNNQSGGQPTAVDLTPIKELFDSSDQIRGSGSLRVEQDSTPVTGFEGIVCSKFGRTRYRATGAYPPSSIRHQVQQGIFSFGRHGHRMQPFRLGQHRALEIQASVCGRCVEVPCHPLVGRLQCKQHSLAE